MGYHLVKFSMSISGIEKLHNIIYLKKKRKII